MTISLTQPYMAWNTLAYQIWISLKGDWLCNVTLMLFILRKKIFIPKICIEIILININFSSKIFVNFVCVFRKFKGDHMSIIKIYQSPLQTLFCRLIHSGCLPVRIFYHKYLHQMGDHPHYHLSQSTTFTKQGFSISGRDYL